MRADDGGSAARATAKRRQAMLWMGDIYRRRDTRTEGVYWHAGKAGKSIGSLLASLVLVLRAYLLASHGL